MPDKFNNTSNETVRKATGKTWDEWIKIFDTQDATKLDHTARARWLYDHYHNQGLSGWWSQMVTVGYEQAKGLRQQNQNTQGFAVSVSRTVAISLSSVYKTLQTEFNKQKIEITTANKDKGLRGKASDGSRVIVGLYDKKGKTQIALQVEKLKDAKAVEAQRAHWKKTLGRLYEN